MNHVLHTVDEINWKAREIKISVDLLRTAAFLHDTVKPNVAMEKEDSIVLCHADISAQSEIVFMNGVQVDFKEHKLSKIAEIKRILTTI